MIARSSTRMWRSPTPVNMRLTLAPLKRGAGDPTFRGGPDDAVWRTTRTNSGAAIMTLAPVGSHTICAEAWGPGREAMLDDLPDLLGAADDPSSFEPRHPILADAHRRLADLRIGRTGRLMEALVPAVLEQKVLGLDAFASWRRLLIAYGEPAPGPAPAGMAVFPEPAVWAAIPSWEWHRAGVDLRRARVVQACAQLGDRLEQVASVHRDDPPHVYRALRSIPGVGQWTAAEAGSRALGDADAVSIGDLHLGTLVGTALGGAPLRDDEVEEFLEPWRPHRRRVVRLLHHSPLVRIERRAARMPRLDHRRR